MLIRGDWFPSRTSHKCHLLDVYRRRKIVEGKVLQILTHPNFGSPTNDLTSPLYQIGGPRSIQLALRLQF